MRLADFYSLNEAHRWTLEHEGNGIGRVLQWEEDIASDDPEGEPGMSYEVVAKGGIDQLLTALPGMLDFDEAELRDAWEDAVSTGDVVEIEEEDGTCHIRMAPRRGNDEYEGLDELY